MDKKPDWMTAEGPPWTRGEAREVYANPWLKVTEYDAVAPTGRPALYGVVHFQSHAIGILPLHDDGTVTLVGQHRVALESARRELAEEAGLAARKWRQVLSFELSNSVTDERGFGYLATGLYPASGEPDDTELIRLARVPFREALDAALSGHMSDMITVALLLRAYHMAREGELAPALTEAML